MIKAILFDWGDTLAPGVPMERFFPLERIKRRFQLSERQLEQCLEKLKDFNPPDPSTLEAEKKLLTRFWSHCLGEIKVENPEPVKEYLLEWTFKKATPVPFPGVLGTIRYLAKKNYELAVLTNSWPSRLLEVKRSAIGKYFKTILVSAIIRAEKPEPRAYKIAIKEIGLAPREILFADNKEHLLVPAQKLGLQVVYVDRINFNPDSPFPRVEDLPEIINLFNL